MKIRDTVEIKKGISKKRASQTLTIIFIIATLSLITCLINNKDLEHFIGQEKQPHQIQTNNLSSEKKMLGCARKIDRDYDLLHSSSNKDNDCIFMGCGDFFQ